MDCCLELADAGALRGPAGPGRRRAHQRGQRDGGQGARWASTSTSTSCPCASAWPRRRSWCPRARSGCWRWSSPGAWTRWSPSAAAGTSTPRPSATVTEGENLVARSGGEVRGRPARPGCWPTRPRSTTCRARPAPAPDAARPRRRSPSRPTSPAPGSTLLARPNIASKRWIYERYDHLVGANTIRRPGGDAAVVRLPGSERAIALTTDCAERHCELDPRGGGPGLGARGRPQPGVRRRAAGGGDRLPQLPQPREGLHGLAAGRGDRGDERRAAGPWACRSCPGTCPSTMRARAGRSSRRRWWG